jgi:hypothetical protein
MIRVKSDGVVQEANDERPKWRRPDYRMPVKGSGRFKRKLQVIRFIFQQCCVSARPVA